MSFTSVPLPKLSRTIPLIQPTKQESIANKIPEAPEIPEIPKDKTQTKKAENPFGKIIQKGNILHVSNISPKLTYEQIKKGLYDLFSVHGPIFEILIKTKDTGQHFAFIDFPDVKDAEKAVISSKTEPKRLEGRCLMVNYCEDPKKNQARKDQKCFLCHSTGHKAMKCPVKPQMIKPKPKKIQDFTASEEQTNFMEMPGPVHSKKQERVQESPEKESSIQQQSECSEQAKQRDRDYLRFLKLKRKLLLNKMKKIKKPRKRRT